MAGHFHYRGVHVGFQPRAPQARHGGLYLVALALAAIVAFAWTRQPVHQLLPIPSP